MAAFYTLGELRKRLSAIAPRDLEMADICNEIVARAYSIGRWPDSEVEVTIASADKRKEETSGDEYENEWFVYMDADKYDGVLSFKVDGKGGYSIRPLAAEYGDTAAYWAGFIDHGMISASNERRYRMPSGVGGNSRITALAKKRWNNVYKDSDIIPIRPFSAIKAGVMATKYENNNALQEAQAKWQEFEALLMRDDKQFTGVKNLKMRYKLGTSSPPTNFM